jgi:hypothetical protein
MSSATAQPRVIWIAHASPGRLRLRLPWLRADHAAATALADHIAGRPGVIEVAVRPRTGSVLCRYDARRTNAGKLIAAVQRETRVATVLRPGAAVPAATRAARPPGSSVGRALVEAFRGLDEDIHAATSGRVDLGTLAGLGLLTAGAAEVAVTRKLPAPPWFSLAWWAFRTFTMFEPGAPVVPPPHDDLAARRRARRSGTKPRSARSARYVGRAHRARR